MAVLGEDWQFLSVKSFDGGCYVEAHVPYKTPVSRACYGGLAFGSACKKLLEFIIYVVGVLIYTLHFKAGSVVCSCRFYRFFGKFTIEHGLL